MKIEQQINIIKNLVKGVDTLSNKYQEGWEEDILQGKALLKHLKNELKNNKLG